jgi:hypothetical protein
MDRPRSDNPRERPQKSTPTEPTRPLVPVENRPPAHWRVRNPGLAAPSPVRAEITVNSLPSPAALPLRQSGPGGGTRPASPPERRIERDAARNASPRLSGGQARAAFPARLRGIAVAILAVLSAPFTRKDAGPLILPPAIEPVNKSFDESASPHCVFCAFKSKSAGSKGAVSGAVLCLSRVRSRLVYLPIECHTAA